MNTAPPKPIRYRAKPGLPDVLTAEGRTSVWLGRMIGAGSRANTHQIITGKRGCSLEQAETIAHLLNRNRDDLFSAI